MSVSVNNSRLGQKTKTNKQNSKVGQGNDYPNLITILSNQSMFNQKQKNTEECAFINRSCIMD